MSLDELRRRIDAIDDAVLSLLDQRAEVVGQVGEEKRRLGLPFHDPERERTTLDRLAARGAGRFPREAIRAVYREVMSACLALQSPVSVAFLGPEGTFTHAAARSLFGLAARYREASTLEGVVDAVRRGASTYGVVPVENSTEGSVTSATDALLEGGAQIRAERVLSIDHCLLARAPELGAVERVYSHPQALAQCRGWLARNLPGAQLIQTTSTAGAVREASGDPGGAAVASALAGELHGLPMLRPHIQDRSENATRFVVVGQADAPRTGRDKTTVAFSLADEPGALRSALEIFHAQGLNLSRIESRPSRQRAWEYVFLADLHGHREDEPVARALDALRARCAAVTLLGSYARDDGEPAAGGSATTQEGDAR